MEKKEMFEYILKAIPTRPPYRYIDEILHVDDETFIGCYTFKDSEFFYKGHFPGNPVTPGAILVEMMAQIGLLAFGIYLTREEQIDSRAFFFTSSDVAFLKPVLPNQKLTVESKKVYFRFGKLKCEVKVFNENRQVICKGILAGIMQ